MMLILLVLACAFVGIPLLGLWGYGRPGGWIFVAVNGLTLLATLALAGQVALTGGFTAAHEQFVVDDFSMLLVLVDGVVGFSTALFSRGYMAREAAHWQLSRGRMRLYHVMFQTFLFTMLLALLTNSMGILWVAMEGATLATVLLVSLFRTAEGLEAAWKYFILCGVGLAMALFGTILLYFAAQRVLGSGSQALLWTHLDAVRGQLQPHVMAIAFVFVLVGYGTKVGLAPLHNWLPDAHASGPSSVSAVLSGLLLNVALYAVLRTKVLVDGAVGPDFAAHLLMGFGLLSLLVAAFSMLRQRDVKRLFAYSSVEHMGLATFAFGVGGPVASFAGILHMLSHSLTKSAVFFSVGQAVQTAGSREIQRIHGLLEHSPVLGWAMMLAVLAILGMPPSGLFLSEFLIITSTMHAQAWATPLLLLGLGVAFAAIFPRLQGMVFGRSPWTHAGPAPVTMLPVFVQLALVGLLGVFIPVILVQWMQHAAAFLN
ncbi:hydrogenase 4 subunit F [Acidithiobacillus sp.]|uniref:hydrogenase 4 subunit F n=1 Tax=Acidithiobacillus sp. TaxID=1872118 RepID=UPI003D03A1F8